MNIKNRLKSDQAYMGYTHTLSALAAFFLIVAFVPAFNNFLNFENIWILILACLTTVGASTIPDLDNSKSTIKSNLGVIGDVLSSAFRGFSVIIQSVIKTKKDDPTPDPHRGFWHTIVGSVLFGLFIKFITGIKGSIEIPILGEVSFGYVIGFILTVILIQLFLVTIIDKLLKNIGQKSLGRGLSFIVSFFITFLLFTQIPTDTDFLWLVVSVVLGMVIHIIGDTTTTSGTCLLWPIPIRGKMWWNIRLTSMKAGSDTEKTILIPLFAILSIIGIFFTFQNGVI